MWGKVGPLLDEMVSYHPRCCARSSQCVAEGKDKNGFFSWVHLLKLAITVFPKNITAAFMCLHLVR